jgi:uncharacterized protein YkwD
VTTAPARIACALLLVLTLAAALTAAAFASVPAVTATATCPGSGASVRRAPAQILRTAEVCLINQQRALHHLPALRESVLLDHSAQGWTNVMVARDEFTHGSDFAGRITAAGYHWRAAGENIATGFATPRSVVGAWMASTGHCQNILNPTYRNVGTGVSGRPVRGWASGGGTWTQDFGLGINQSAPSGDWGPADHCPY